MGAIRACRTAALGGHVLHCSDCDHATIAYNFCRNRHCPRCQGAAAKDWLANRQPDLLPVPYYHLVFTASADRGHRLPEQSRRLQLNPTSDNARAWLSGRRHVPGSSQKQR